MRSHINTATFTKRIPTEQYAYEEYSLTAAIDASESGEEVLIEMRKQVSNAFAADLIEATEKKEETKSAKKAAKKEEKKNEKPGKSKARIADDEDEIGEDSADDDTGDDVEGPEDDEAADDDVQDDVYGDSDDGEGDEDGADDEGSEDGDEGGDEEEDSKPAKSKGKSAAKAPAKASEGKKGFRKKPQTYNRGIDQHREIFSRVLRSVSPDWKNSDVLKARAKKISESMEGEAFLDENGEVLPEFKAEVKKGMSGKAK